MVKKVVILMIFLLSSLSIISEKIGTLKEINKPRLMAISRNHLFISEKTTVSLTCNSSYFAAHKRVNRSEIRDLNHIHYRHS